MDTLYSGDETFEEEESNDSSISSEIPHYLGESEVENKSEREDHDDAGDQSDGAAESILEMRITEIDSLVSERCRCCIENHVSVLVAQSIVTIQHQVCEDKSRDKDIFLLGMLATAQHKEEIAHTRRSESATPRDFTTLLYTVK